MANDPGSAAFVGLSYTADGQEYVIGSNLTEKQFTGDDHLASQDLLDGYTYDAAHQTITLSADVALKLGLLSGNTDGFDYVIRMANGTYSEAHVTLTGLPDPVKDGHWVDVVDNGGFDIPANHSGTWSGTGGSPDGGVGFWTEGTN
ncbi:MAG: hypothetical protein LBE86_01350, partial [Gemmobacter sp.]|nr:hypothetical protein [Gemmobacter sp.]